MSNTRSTTPRPKPSHVSPSAYNDLLRATSRPRRPGPEWQRPISLPPPLNSAWVIKEGDLDILYLRTLPEFEHWRTYGWEFVCRDLHILESGGMSLLGLFRRGPVSPSWYRELDRAENEDGAEGIEGERVQRGSGDAESIMESRRIGEDPCGCRDCQGSSRTVRAPTRTLTAEKLSPRPRERQPAQRREYKSPSASGTDLHRPLRRQYTPEPSSSRLTSATPVAEEPQGMTGVVYLAHSPSFILQAPTLKEFAKPGSTTTFMAFLYRDVEGLERLASGYRRSYEKLWVEIEDDGVFRADPEKYKEMRDYLERGY